MKMSIDAALQQFMEAILAAGAVLSLEEVTREVRFRMVASYLKRNRGNQVRTARALDIHRNTLSRAVQEIRKAGRPDPVKLANPKKSGSQSIAGETQRQKASAA